MYGLCLKPYIITTNLTKPQKHKLVKLNIKSW